MSTTPMGLRAAYLVVVGSMAALERRRSDATMELRRVDEALAQHAIAKESLLAAICRRCNGYGYVQVQYDQDDIKAEKCERCGGTGLPVAETEAPRP